MRKIYALSGVCLVSALAVIAMLIASDDGNAIASKQEVNAPVARSQQTFILPTDDGYGINECLAKQSSCGQSVADAWCKVKGHGDFVAFGVVAHEDITATIQIASTTPKQINRSDRYYVTCK